MRRASKCAGEIPPDGPGPSEALGAEDLGRSPRRGASCAEGWTSRWPEAGRSRPAGSRPPGRTAGPLLVRLVAAAGMMVLTVGTGSIVGCSHPDAGSINLTAAKEAADKQGLKMLAPGSVKKRGRGPTKPKGETLKLAPSGRASAKY